MIVSKKRVALNLALAGLSCLAMTAAAVATGSTPDAAQDVAAAAAPAQPAPAHVWSAEAIASLQAEIAAAGYEGLDPSTYDAAALAGRAEGAETDRIATRIAVALALDYARGSTDDPARLDWYIARPSVDVSTLSAGIEAAVRENRLRPYLRGLLPADARYAALRQAYAAAPATDIALRDRLRANLERWRWMPRDLGPDQIYVNVPSYTLTVVDGGKPVSTYTVVVGAPSTPTPQIASEARSVVVNPWWNVPVSIARKMRAPAARGFVVSGNAIRQRPGPGNALGKVKIDMPNPHSIYLHDTPSKALFAKESRAFSHGCIRVKDIDKLARQLAELDSRQPAEVERALAGSATRTVPLQRQRPVYLVYFTAEAGADGEVKLLEDPYGRDAKLVASIDREVKLAAARRKTATSAA